MVRMLDFIVQFYCGGEWASGVFVKLEDEERDCIITAAHCLEGYSDKEDIKFQNKDYQVISVLPGDKDIFDVAYIFIEKQVRLDFQPYNINDRESLSMEKIKILGYPGIKIDKPIKYAELNCTCAAWREANIINIRVTDSIESLYVEGKILIDGMSGGAAYIEQNSNIYLIGIISKVVHSNFEYKEISIIPFQIIINHLNEIGIHICFQQTESVLADIIERIDPGYEEWRKLEGRKDRTYEQKILDVCSEYNERRLKRFSRKIADANLELERLPTRQKAALLYRIFRGANDAQFELVEQGIKELSEEEILEWLEEYSKAAQEMIITKSSDYDYPLRNEDLIRNSVIKLIDECYLSFDEEGLIE